MVHTPDNLPDAGTNVTGAGSNIECMMYLLLTIFNLQHACGYQISFELYSQRVQIF